ncbi:hypothetical protein Tco_1292535 [Tanacetum coccineum]
MQRPPLFEATCFIYWKNRFETYVKSKDIDLWHIIVNGDCKPTIKNLVTGQEELISYDILKDEHKKMLSKNDEAKMVLYNALPKKEYERIYMCKTAKDVWNSLVITHQDSDDEQYAMAVNDFKNFFRRREKFVRQLHDDKKNFRRAKEEQKGKEERRCFKCGDPNHFISDSPKHSFNDQKSFVGGCWSDSDEDDDSKKDEICLMAHDTNEVLSDTLYYRISSLDS